MYSPGHALQNVISILMEFSGNLGQEIMSYIDPNTMHHVFTFLGPILAFFIAVAGVLISAVLFLRYHLVAWFRKARGAKLVAMFLVLVLITTGAMVFVYKLILYVIAH